MDAIEDPFGNFLYGDTIEDQGSSNMGRGIDGPNIALSNGENRRSIACSYQKLFAIFECRVTYGPPCILSQMH